jgi:hypothetical protein
MSARHRTTPAVTIRLSDELYLRRLRALGAWWCLGSSVLDPGLLVQYVPLRLSALREAGL